MSNNTEQAVVPQKQARTRYVITTLTGIASLAIFVALVMLAGDESAVAGFGLWLVLGASAAATVVMTYALNAVMAFGNGRYKNWKRGTYRLVMVVFAIQCALSVVAGLR